MNKKGMGDMMMFVAFFMIMMIIGAGIAWGVVAFYSEGYDYRRAESSAIAAVVYPCLLEKDFTIPDFDIYEECGLNQNVIEDSKHAVLIKSIEEDKFILEKGVADYKNQCFLNSKDKSYPVCIVKKFEKGGQEYELIVGSSQNSVRQLG